MRKKSMFIASFILIAETFAFLSPAEAVVCAQGVVRAGCVGPNGAVVVSKPAPVTTCRIVNGVRVCKSRW
jgi:hypothetical protein